MKRTLTHLTAALCVLALTATLPLQAQTRPRGRYTPPAPRHGSYSSRSYSYAPNTYFGFRFGLSA